MQARLVESKPEQVSADALILPLFEDQKTLPAEAARLNQKLGGAVQEMIRNRQFRGKLMEQLPVHNLSRIPSKLTLLVGLGKTKELDLVRLRNTLQAAGRWLRKHGARRVAGDEGAGGLPRPCNRVRAVLWLRLVGPRLCA